jgi:hypothetical protein
MAEYLADAASGRVQHSFFPADIRFVHLNPATVIVHGYPAAFFNPVKPIFVLLQKVISRPPSRRSMDWSSFWVWWTRIGGCLILIFFSLAMLASQYFQRNDRMGTVQEHLAW